jgi:hypothetical protein
MPVQESYAKTFIAQVRHFERCDWCGRDKPKKRNGLCRHCDDVRRSLEKVENEAASKRLSFGLDFNLRVAREKKKDCINWGKSVKNILDGQVSPLELEHRFRRLAECIARDKRMHYGIATMLGWTFTAEQRQVLAYLFWQIFAEHASRNRQNRAYGRAGRSMSSSGER